MRALLPLVLFFGLLAAGCGTKTYPVQGTVLNETGKPAVELAGGTVQFEALDAPVSAEGTIAADGTFRLGTHRPGDGAVAGKHRVAVTPPAAGANFDSPRRELIERKYQDAATSGIVVEVEPRENTVTITVARPRR